MKDILHYFALIMLFLASTSEASLYKKMRSSTDHQPDVTWTIVGAGPAGIAVIGVLLDAGVDEKNIIWIDPGFNVGRLGAYYYNVPGNALAQNYISFVNECDTFKQCSSPSLEYLRAYYPYECCNLQVAIDALRDITAHLKTRIGSYMYRVSALHFIENNWLVSLDNGISFSSHNVVFATGSHPKVLNYPSEYIIPLDDALDITRLASHLQPNDTVALVGGSHSGILILKYLHELKVKRIINFYRYPITYAYDMGNNNIPDYNGLKGDVAEWAFDVLEHGQPETIVRVKNTEAARDSWLPLCNKIIYAIGFERNILPLIDIDNQDLVYDDTTGVMSQTINPRLFCIGIAFPEKIIDPWGKSQHTVGMIDFLTYAQRIVPQWIDIAKRVRNYLYQHNNLLDIQLITTIKQ